MSISTFIQFPGILITIGVLLLIVAIVIGVVAYKREESNDDKIFGDLEDDIDNDDVVDNADIIKDVEKKPVVDNSLVTNDVTEDSLNKLTIDEAEVKENNENNDNDLELL